jgi:CRP/FNR family cyclic AMP-dependent transcriptional regulator
MPKQRKFASGEVIIYENDIGETAYVIEQGRVKVTKKRGGRTVHLAELGPGGTIGEMSMIDEKPRSATVVAIEDSILREVHRSQFSEALQRETDSAIRLLRVIFERLREADARIAELASYLQPEDSKEDHIESSNPGIYALLEAQTTETQDLLPAGPLLVKQFPFRIGRPSNDPLVHNDLSLACPKPYQLSRHHVSIVRSEGKIGVIDRGSARGSAVNGKVLGGEQGTKEPIFFPDRGGLLRLGDENSKFIFHVNIERHVNL